MGAGRFLAVLAAVLLTLPMGSSRASEAPAAPDGVEQPLWQEVFTLDGDGPSAMLEYRGKLYLGEFDAGGMAKIYVYDGASWSVALQTDDEGVTRMEVYQDVLYVSVLHRYNDPAKGQFSGYVRYFNGTTWGVMSQTNAPDRWTQSLHVYQGKLFAGGTSPGGAWTKSWDGAQWVQTGTPSSFGGVGHVEDAKNLEVHSDGNLYLVTNYGGYAFRYDGGTSWTELLDGQDFGGGSCSVKNGAMNAIRSFNGDLFAGTYCGGTVYRYNGLTWSNITVLNEGVTALFGFDDYLYAAVRGGWKDVYRFDGATWEVAYDSGSFTFGSFGTYSPEENLYAAAHNGTAVKVFRRNSVPIPPVADAGPPQQVEDGATVVLDGSGSTDNIGVTNFTWTFNDGTGPVTLYGASASHTFPVSGQYLVTLSVSDNAGLSDSDTTWVNVSADVTPPATVTDLAVEGTTTTTATLSWTAPGDNDNQGTASQYDLRWSTTPLDNTSWIPAQQVAGEPAPSAEGTLESFTVDGLTPATDYWFALKTADEVPNWSDLSNVVSARTAVPSGQPAKVAFTFPRDGQIDVQQGATVFMAFSKPMDPASVEASLTYTDGQSAWTGQDGTTTWSTAFEVAFFVSSVGFTADKTYTFTLDGSIAKDSSGVYLDGDGDGVQGGDYSWSFTIEGPPDVDPPRVVNVVPRSGATDVPVDSAVRLQFSESMDTSSVEGSLRYAADNVTHGVAGGTVAWDAEQTEMTFRPSGGMSYGTTYSYELLTGATDTFGNALASPFSWTFSTESGLTSVEGLVWDDKGQPVGGAVISVDNVSTTTDQNGSFLIAGLPPGNYTMEVTAPGFRPYVVPVTTEPGEELSVTVALSRPPRGTDVLPWLLGLGIAAAVGVLILAVRRRRRGHQA